MCKKKPMPDENRELYKVLIIGDPSVKKTSLLTKFVTKKFEGRYLPRVGVNIVRESINLDNLNVTVDLMFWDVAGQPHFYMLHRPYFNGADGMILVFDVARSSTFSNINNWYSTAVKYGLSGIPRILVGNRINLEDERKITLQMAEHLSSKLNAPYFETSLITGVNIDLIFHKIAELIYEAKKSQNNRDIRYDPMVHEKTEGFHNRRYNAYKKQGIPKRRDYISSKRFKKKTRKKDKKEKRRRTFIKEKEEFQKIIEEGLRSGFKIKHMKGCLMCGSSKIIKKASPIVYKNWASNWANSDPPSHIKMYRIRNECRECGHIWYEDTSYYINKKILFFFIIFSLIFSIIFLSCLVFIMEI